MLDIIAEMRKSVDAERLMKKLVERRNHPHLPPAGRRKPEMRVLSGVKEIAALLGVCPTTVTNWRKKGMPITSSPGGRRVFARQDKLLAWIGQKDVDGGE